MADVPEDFLQPPFVEPVVAEASAATVPRKKSSFERSTRETIESIAIAFALAFLFKTFQAEAFVIPTGSMAPTLMGRHKDVACPECGYRYTASGSEEADRDGNLRATPDGALDEQYQVISCTCPVCRFPMSVDPQNPQAVERQADVSYSGDRIWVSKVPYHFADPRRFDVVVFRFPEEPQTYYIKRLVGLPGETIKLSHGDIYARKEGEADFQIVRKPSDKVLAMAQVVHDNDYQCPDLVEQSWPLRWQPWSGAAKGSWRVSEDRRAYATDGSADGETWIRYQHVFPSEHEWHAVVEKREPLAGRVRPQLITDFYAFNSRVLRGDYGSPPHALGLHWVGDLIVECQLDVEGNSGAALFDLVRGGQHYRCSLDAASGEATLSIDDQPDWKRTAATKFRGPGKHTVRFANVDQQLLLWIDNKLIAFNEPTTYDRAGDDTPKSDPRDPGDLAPLAIGSQGLAMKADKLRVLRDVYYIADSHPTNVMTDFHGPGSVVPMMRTEELISFLSTPAQWESPRGGAIFKHRQEVTFPLEADQFFVLGDNSPASADARLWLGQHYVDRKLLVGKALYVYWPHPWGLPLPFTDATLPLVPNFSKMGFIR